MLGTKQKKWVAALRSGNYKQGVGELKTKNVGPEKETLHCCLGVACDIFHWKETNNTDLQTNFSKLGLKDKIGSFDYNDNKTCLTELNDHGKSFLEIADFIEQHPNLVFRKPV